MIFKQLNKHRWVIQSDGDYKCLCGDTRTRSRAEMQWTYLPKKRHCPLTAKQKDELQYPDGKPPRKYPPKRRSIRLPQFHGDRIWNLEPIDKAEQV